MEITWAVVIEENGLSLQYCTDSPFSSITTATIRKMIPSAFETFMHLVSSNPTLQVLDLARDQTLRASIHPSTGLPPTHDFSG